MSAPVEVTYDHQLTTVDGQRLDVCGSPDESIVDAAERAGILLPASCRGGNCGSCHATATGEYTLGEYSRAVLPDDEAARGGVLLCRTYAHGPLEISLPCDHSRILFGTIPERTATITSLDEVARDTVRLALQLGPDPEGGTGCEFEPGQFIELAPPGGSARRAYSLANVANWDGVAELYIRLRPGGYFSEYLRTAAVGGTLTARGPQGAFGLRDTGLRPRWFIAGGTGLAPLLSMVRRMAEWGEPHPARLYFGVETLEDVFAAAELDELVESLPGFSYQIVVRQPAQSWTGATGTPVDALARDLPGVTAAPDIYVCGPPPMVDAVRRTTREHGIAADRVIVENFAPSAA